LPNAAGNNALGPLPYPNFGFIEWREQNGKSEYKGIDFGLDRRFANGWSFGISYTLGDSKDNSSEQLTTQGSNAFPQEARNFAPWYGPSDYDVRHRLAVNFVAELPFGAGKHWANTGAGKAILGGWTFSGIYAARSGRPFTVNQGNNNVGLNMTGLPNVVGDPNGPKTVDQWFNTAAFKPGSWARSGNKNATRLPAPACQTSKWTLRPRAGQLGSVRSRPAEPALRADPGRDRPDGLRGHRARAVRVSSDRGRHARPRAEGAPPRPRLVVRRASPRGRVTPGGVGRACLAGRTPPRHPGRGGGDPGRRRGPEAPSACGARGGRRPR